MLIDLLAKATPPKGACEEALFATRAIFAAEDAVGIGCGVGV